MATSGRGVNADKGVSVFSGNLSGRSCSEDREGHAAGLGIGMASLILLRSGDSFQGSV